MGAVATINLKPSSELLATSMPSDGYVPGFTQDAKVLNRFVGDLVEAEPLVRVGVIVQRDAVETAASRVAGRGARVGPRGALGMEIRGPGPKARQGCRRIHGLDR